MVVRQPPAAKASDFIDDGRLRTEEYLYELLQFPVSGAGCQRWHNLVLVIRFAVDLLLKRLYFLWRHRRDQFEEIPERSFWVRSAIIHDFLLSVVIYSKMYQHIHIFR